MLPIDLLLGLVQNDQYVCFRYKIIDTRY